MDPTRFIASLLLTISSFAFVQGDHTDKRIGIAAFHILKEHDEIMMHPMATPDFKLEWLSGPKPTGNEVLQCTVFARDFPSNLDSTNITVTVLKCGETEYGIKEVDFVFDGVDVKQLKK